MHCDLEGIERSFLAFVVPTQLTFCLLIFDNYSTRKIKSPIVPSTVRTVVSASLEQAKMELFVGPILTKRTCFVHVHRALVGPRARHPQSTVAMVICV